MQEQTETTEKKEEVKKDEILETLSKFAGKGQEASDLEKRLSDSRNALRQEQSKIDYLKGQLRSLNETGELEDEVYGQLKQRLDGYEPTPQELLNSKALSSFKKAKLIFKKNVENIRNYSGIENPKFILNNLEHFYKNVANDEGRAAIEAKIFENAKSPEAVVKNILALKDELDEFYSGNNKNILGSKHPIEAELENFGGFDGFLTTVKSQIDAKEQEIEQLRVRLSKYEQSNEELNIKKEKGYSVKKKGFTELPW
jgi:chromosome segregation ATPase